MYTYLARGCNRVVLPNPHPGGKDRIILEKLKRKIEVLSVDDEPGVNAPSETDCPDADTADVGPPQMSADGNGRHPWDSDDVPPGADTERLLARRAVTRRLRTRSPGAIRLWTLHPSDVWEHLRGFGVLHVDPALITPSFFHDFHPSYDWMREQMAQRLIGYEGHYPWWAWSRPKPDLRRWYAHYFGTGTRCVRLELAVPEERVLRFNESAWIVVLNRLYLALTRAEDEQWEANLAQQGLEPVAESLPERWDTHRVASWERIFDLEAIEAGGLYSDAVEAAFERLDLADVTAVTEFTAR